jgi:hypothetical protein
MKKSVYETKIDYAIAGNGVHEYKRSVNEYKYLWNE